MKTVGWRRIVKLAVMGAVAFWLPDAVWTSCDAISSTELTFLA
jgi:hypothetical protein